MRRFLKWGRWIWRRLVGTDSFIQSIAGSTRYGAPVASTGAGNPSQWDLGRLRRYVRRLVENDAIVRRYVELMEAQVLGEKGLRPSYPSCFQKGAIYENTKKKLLADFSNWSEAVSIDGGMSFYDLQKYILRRALVDGEVLLRFRYLDGMLRIQPVDVDLLEEDGEFRRMASGGVLAYGIETDANGKIVRFHFSPSRRGWNDTIDFWLGGVKTSRPAAEFVFWRKQTFPNQLRGVSQFTSSIRAIDELAKYDEATLKGMVISNLFSLFIENKGVVGANPDDAEDREEAKQPLRIEPGAINYLDSGQEMKPFTPAAPGFNQTQARMELFKKLAAGLNISYNSLMGDWSNTSYSSSKAITLADRDMYRQWQKDLGKIVQQIFAQWFAGWYSENTTPKMRRFFSAPEWRGRSWGWLDPSKELNPLFNLTQRGIIPPQILAEKLGLTAEELRGLWDEAEELDLLNYNAQPEVKKDGMNADEPKKNLLIPKEKLNGLPQAKNLN